MWESMFEIVKDGYFEPLSFQFRKFTKTLYLKHQCLDQDPFRHKTFFILYFEYSERVVLMNNIFQSLLYVL